MNVINLWELSLSLSAWPDDSSELTFLRPRLCKLDRCNDLYQTRASSFNIRESRDFKWNWVQVKKYMEGPALNVFVCCLFLFSGASPKWHGFLYCPRHESGTEDSIA